MKIEPHPTTSTHAEAVQAKAEARLLLEENGKLREAIEMARQCIDADDVIGAHNILVTALEGGKDEVVKRIHNPHATELS